MNITQRDARNIADSNAVYLRGVAYAKQGKVKKINITEKTIIAEVKGSYGMYTVELAVDDEGNIDGDCDCPYEGNGCKHKVAVLCKAMENGAWNIDEKLIKRESFQERIIKSITFNDIAKKNNKEIIFKAFDLYKNTAIKKSLQSILTVNVLEHEKVYEVLLGMDASRDGRCFSECSCNRWGNAACVHMVAVLLSFLEKKEGAEKIEAFKNEIHKLMMDEKFLSFVEVLGSSDGVKQTQKHDFFFSFEKRGNEVRLSVKKRLLLKNGGFGLPSCVKINTLEKALEYLPVSKKKIIGLFLLSLENEDNYFSEEATKGNFGGFVDAEIFEEMRKLYEIDPGSFPNAIFIQGKGEIVLDIHEKENNDALYVLNTKIFINDQAILLQNAIVLDDNLPWVCVYNNEQKKIMMIKCNVSQMVIVKKLLSIQGLEMDSVRLEEFIEKYYLKVSSFANVVLPERKRVIEKGFEPVPRLFLKDNEHTFTMELRFLYDVHEINMKNTHDIIYKNSAGSIVKINRDREKESMYYKLLFDNHVIERDGIIFPSIDPYVWLVDVTKNLVEEGFELYGQSGLQNQKIRNEEPQLHVDVRTGIDWFELNGTMTFGKEEFDLSSMINAVNNHERFIKLNDGSVGVLPKKWFEKLSGVAGLLEYDRKEKKTKAAVAQLAIVEAIVSIAKEKRVDDKFTQLQEKFLHFNGIKDVPLPQQLQGTLREYQKAGYNWLHFLKEFSFGGCLADEMGLGKTVQVLAFLLYEKQQGNMLPSLIVVPLSLVFNWVNEVKKFAPSLCVYVHHGQERVMENDLFEKGHYDLIITTYGTLRNDIDLFKEQIFFYIVLDESQHIKNPLSKNAKSTYHLQTMHRLVLTGTPIENNSLELWSQFAFINPGLLGSMEYFSKTFTKSIDKDKDKDKTNALRNMIHPFLLMRKKDAVAKELPEKQITVNYCSMTVEQRSIYDCWKEKFRQEIIALVEEKGFAASRMKIIQGLTLLRQICNHPVLIDESYMGESGKFNALVEQISEVIKEGHKVLVFSSFVKMLNIFKKYFTRQNIRFCYLDGSTKNRQEVVNQFQNDDSFKLFLISIKAGGLGLNLTAADYVFIVDPWWNPAVEMQAIDRAHRIGQKNNVFVYKAITKDSIEEKILELQESKIDLVKNVITIDEGIFKTLKQEDIKDLFI